MRPRRAYTSGVSLPLSRAAPARTAAGCHTARVSRNRISGGRPGDERPASRGGSDQNTTAKAAIEIKASSTVVAGDFRGLRHLAERIGDDFIAGLVFYTGTQTLPFGPRLPADPAPASTSSSAALVGPQARHPSRPMALSLL